VIVTGYVTRPWGTNYVAWGQVHPLSPYYKMKASDVEALPLHLQSSRVGYRQWLGMAVETQDGLRIPARCLTEFARYARDLTGTDKAAVRDSRLLVAGYAMDNMKPLDFAEALLPLIISNHPEAIRRRGTRAGNSSLLIEPPRVLGITLFRKEFDRFATNSV
jgi:CRISPR system Cascade subunit CasA